MAKTFICQVITPEGPLVRRRVTSAVFPAKDGQYGVLPDHAPMMSLVGTGSVAMRGRLDDVVFLELSGGFAVIRQGVLTILAEHAGRMIKTMADAGGDEREHLAEE